MNLTFLATELERKKLIFQSQVGVLPNILIVDPAMFVDLSDHVSFTGSIAQLRVIESINITTPVLAYVDAHSLGTLARFNA